MVCGRRLSGLALYDRTVSTMLDYRLYERLVWLKHYYTPSKCRECSQLQPHLRDQPCRHKPVSAPGCFLFGPNCVTHPSNCILRCTRAQLDMQGAIPTHTGCYTFSGLAVVFDALSAYMVPSQHHSISQRISLTGVTGLPVAMKASMLSRLILSKSSQLVRDATPMCGSKETLQSSFRRRLTPGSFV